MLFLGGLCVPFPHRQTHPWTFISKWIYTGTEHAVKGFIGQQLISLMYNEPVSSLWAEMFKFYYRRSQDSKAFVEEEEFFNIPWRKPLEF